MNKIIKNTLILTAITVVSGLLLGIVSVSYTHLIADYFRPIRDEALESGLLNPKNLGVIGNLRVIHGLTQSSDVFRIRVI